MSGKFNLRMDTIWAFFPQKSGHFFWFSRKGRGGLPPSSCHLPPSSCMPLYKQIILFFKISQQNVLMWDLNPWPLNSLQMLQQAELSSHEFNLHSTANFIQLFQFHLFVQCHISFWLLLLSVIIGYIYFNWNFVEVITWV